MIGNIGYLSLALYLLFVALSSTIPSLLIPATVMAALAYAASLGIFVDIVNKMLKKR